MTRYFLRLPAADSIDEALEHAERLGGAEPRLHACDSAVVVGSVELRGEPDGEAPRG